MNITYRNYTQEDIDSIIRFWNENSGWETNMDHVEFNLRFCSSPLGRPIIMLAIDDDVNEVVGLFCFIPLSVTINGHETRCYRPFGAVFKEAFRIKFSITTFLTGKHPILQLYHKGAAEAIAENAVLTYLIPDPRWGKILRVMPFEARQFPLWSYKLSSKEPFELDGNTEIKELEPTIHDIDVLWIQSQKTNLCTLTKNSRFYQLKISASHGRYKLRGVYYNNHLVGLFTLDKKRDSQQWVICDLLTLDNDELLTLTLKAACNTTQVEYLKKQQEPDKLFKAAILATSIIEKKVKSLGFFKDNYNFVLAVHLFDKKNFSAGDVAPEHWYISAND